jgi:hypothetical protein
MCRKATTPKTPNRAGSSLRSNFKCDRRLPRDFESVAVEELMLKLYCKSFAITTNTKTMIGKFGKCVQ